MVLSGTLREFILADVFHLLTQQRITGKLVLSCGNREGAVVFKEGIIVSAENDEEKFPRKLFNFLVEIKHQPSGKIRELFGSFENDVHGLTLEVVKRGIISQEELQDYAVSIIEDLACSLFSWSTGTYRFNSFKNVDYLIPSHVSIPTENIVMEAMRRVDEWNRMQTTITEESVFVRIDKNQPILNDLDLKKQPEEYIFGRIDGASSVKSLIRNSCLTKYHIYESLNLLIESRRIIALSPKISKTITGAEEETSRERIAGPSAIIISFLAASGIVFLVLFLGWFFFRDIIFAKKNEMSFFRRTEIEFSYANKKTLNAATQYHAIQGVKPSRIGDLRFDGLLKSNDLRPLNNVKKRLPLDSLKASLYTPK